jgi:hypothetical protein
MNNEATPVAASDEVPRGASGGHPAVPATLRLQEHDRRSWIRAEVHRTQLKVSSSWFNSCAAPQRPTSFQPLLSATGEARPLVPVTIGPFRNQALIEPELGWCQSTSILLSPL